MTPLDAFRNLPLRRKLAVLVLLSSAVGLVFAAAPLIGSAWVRAQSSAVHDLGTTAQIVADNSAAALAFRDATAAGETLAALRAKPELESACLYTDTGGRTELFAFYPGGRTSVCPVAPGVEGIEEALDALTLVKAVEVKGDRVGWLRVRLSLLPLRRAFFTQIAITLAILGASIAVSLSLAWVMQRVLSRPLLKLTEVARQVSETRDYSLRVDTPGRDEIGRLAGDFNQMLEQIGQRDQELRDREARLRAARDALEQEVREKTKANQELQEALAHLQDAQVQLVQSERLASLGALVAGIAHEINTPVGVGVTAASTLQDRAQVIRQLYESAALKRSDLERFVGLADESTQIILKNLQRAADLIHSFKQVAVDQSSGERRSFALRAYIDEVLLSLAPRLRKAGHSVTVECPDDLVVDSYPGALAQILSNFVSNSILHGYHETQRGHLHIVAAQRDGWVALRYADDGRGIPQEHLSRIFDPFFTTRRGAGGSGLGLHIVYSLVTQLLGGTIEVHSASGHGAEFRIGFPAVARSKAA